MAEGQTVVEYNEITLYNCLTRLFDQQAEQDESGTDLVGFRFKVRVVGFVDGKPVADLPNRSVGVLPTPGVSLGDAAAHEKQVRAALMQPRKYFRMRTGVAANLTGGTILLECNGIQSDNIQSNLTAVDLDNGPKPRVISITQIAGNTLMRVEFEIEILRMECNASGTCPNPSGVLSNRWSVIDDIDDNFHTTRTFTGRLRVASSRVNPNSFRSLCIPPLQDGMRRASMQFLVTPDALNLQYTIVDKEIDFAAPGPATKWNFKHNERIEQVGQVGCFASVQIMLEGPRNCDRKKLIALAAKIAETKLIDANPKSSILQSVEVGDEYGDDIPARVYLSATARRTGAGGEKGAIFGLPAQLLGVPITAANFGAAAVPAYDPLKSRGARQGEVLDVDGPISLIGAFSCYLQTPCDGQHGIFFGKDGLTNATPATKESTAVTAYVTEELPSDGTLDHYNNSAVAAIYTHYQAESIYHTDMVRAHLPIARATASSATKTAIVVTLGYGLPKRTIRIVAERVGQKPSLPYPVDSFSESGINYVLLDKRDNPSVPEYGPDGRQVWRVGVEYTYGMDRGLTVGDNMLAGVNPFDSNGIYKLLISGGDIVPESAFPVG